MTKNEIKKVAQAALNTEYGFKPALNDINIEYVYEEENRPTFITFNVKGKNYIFSSRISHIGGVATVWTGGGTITKLRV